ncbi:MAG TPA: transcriptional repressor LexA [Candidatus Deferrimicrobiaceae bacterium]
MNTPLTAQQRLVLSFIRDFMTTRPFAPTAKEIADRFGIAVKNGYYYLDLLERKGYIRRTPKQHRRIELTGAAAAPPVRVPVLGAVPAGSPREALELADGELLLDASLVGDGEVFALRVTGDSMTGDHIREGDHVLVRCQPDAADGDIVVAVLSGDATVKRLRRRAGNVVLEASNPAYPPIVVPAGAPSFRIAGKVVGLYRKL